MFYSYRVATIIFISKLCLAVMKKSTDAIKLTIYEVVENERRKKKLWWYTVIVTLYLLNKQYLS